MSTTQNLRLINKDKIIKALRELGECNKNQLSQKTLLSLGTCNNILKELIDSNEVIMGEEFESTGGRKARGYKLNGDYSQYLVISLHREYHVVYYIMRVYNLVDEVLYEVTSEPTVIDFDEFCEDIAKVLEQFKNINVVSISIPGVVSQNGCIEEISLSSGFEELRGIHIAEEISKRFNVKVLIENDVNIAAMGYYDDHKDISHLGLIYQPLDDIAGGAIINNGQLQRGSHRFVGEFPFLPFLSRNQHFDELQTKEGTIHLIAKFITTMIVMNDPETLCISCSSIHDIQPLIKEIKKYVPYEHLLPNLILIEDISQYIYSGLLKMSHDALCSNIIMTTQSIYE